MALQCRVDDADRLTTQTVDAPGTSADVTSTFACDTSGQRTQYDPGRACSTGTRVFRFLCVVVTALVLGGCSGAPGNVQRSGSAGASTEATEQGLTAEVLQAQLPVVVPTLSSLAGRPIAEPAGVRPAIPLYDAARPTSERIDPWELIPADPDRYLVLVTGDGKAAGSFELTATPAGFEVVAVSADANRYAEFVRALDMLRQRLGDSAPTRVVPGWFDVVVGRSPSGELSAVFIGGGGGLAIPGITPPEQPNITDFHVYSGQEAESLVRFVWGNRL